MWKFLKIIFRADELEMEQIRVDPFLLLVSSFDNILTHKLQITYF